MLYHALLAVQVAQYMLQGEALLAGFALKALGRAGGRFGKGYLLRCKAELCGKLR